MAEFFETDEPVDYVVAAFNRDTKGQTVSLDLGVQSYRDAIAENETLRQELAEAHQRIGNLSAQCDRNTEQIGRLQEEAAERDADRDLIYALIQTARDATRRLSAVLIANASRLDAPFTNHSLSPWTLHVSPAINRLRQALGMRGAWPVGCTCELHGRTCEPPSELCCENCSESQHPNHVDGSACSTPDLSGNHMPAPVELALRAEVDRLSADRDAMREVVETAKAVRELWRYDAMAAAEPEIHAFVAAVDALSIDTYRSLLRQSTKDDGPVDVRPDPLLSQVVRVP